MTDLNNEIIDKMHNIVSFFFIKYSLVDYVPNAVYVCQLTTSLLSVVPFEGCCTSQRNNVDVEGEKLSQKKGVLLYKNISSIHSRNSFPFRLLLTHDYS